MGHEAKKSRLKDGQKKGKRGGRKSAAKKKQVRVPKEWKCPICPNYSTGVTEFWAQKKAAHVKALHQGETVEWSRKHCTLRTPQKGEKVEWQCKHCPMAIIGMAASSKPAKTARFNHWRKEHPDESRKDFFMPKGAGHHETIRQGNVRASNGKLAKRLLQVAMSGKHAPEQVLYDLGQEAHANARMHAVQTHW